ncbi:MAG: hypothetical protein HOJ35_04035 [Bdellovibrionales bacterium]|jgi:hypothetical protein|nr:hypothetical protein [Bdellovibrionales bacterium]
MKILSFFFIGLFSLPVFSMVTDIDSTTSQPLVLNSEDKYQKFGEIDLNQKKKLEFKKDIFILSYHLNNYSYSYEKLNVDFNDVSSFNFKWLLESGINYKPFVKIGFSLISGDSQFSQSIDGMKFWTMSAGMVFHYSEKLSLLTEMMFDQTPILSIQSDNSNLIDIITVIKLKIGTNLNLFEFDKLRISTSLFLHVNPEVEKANTLVGLGFGAISQWDIRYKFSPKYFLNSSYIYEIEKSKIDNSIFKSDYLIKNSSFSIDMGLLF